MPKIETTSTAAGKVTTKWWPSVLNIQTVVMVFGAFVAVTYFVKDSKDNWNKTKELEKQMIMKADKAETDAKIRAADDKVNRQYENNNRITDRIISLEKQREYDRGFDDGKKTK